MFLSVVIPAYNAERYLRSSVQSVLAQSHGEFECLIVDDGSSDRTLEIATELSLLDERVRIITHANWGMGRSLNHAIEQANADWIARLDADDLMEPDRLARQIWFLSEHPELDVATSLVTFITGDDDVIGQSQPVMTTDEEFRRISDSGVVMGLFHPASMIRKSAFLKVGGFRDQFWPADDLDLWTRIAEAGGRILVQPEALTRYRVHAKSSSFGDARNTAILLGWLHACTANRRQGLPEPSREEFIEQSRRQPLFTRVNQARRDYAYAFYRQATLAYSMGQLPQIAFWLFLATILGSSDVFRQVRRRALRPARQSAGILGRLRREDSGIAGKV